MTEAREYVDELRALFVRLSSERQDYDFQPPALVSHAKDYAADPARLRKYAKQVIAGRIMMLFAFSRMNTQRLLQTFLFGVDSENPFPVLLAARSQLELLAVVADTARTITANAGEQAEDFVKRVTTVDQALISATFGTRRKIVKEQLKVFGLSRLREATEEEYARFSLTATEPFERALVASAAVMVRAALGTLAVMEQLQPPFGMGTVTQLT